MEKARKKKKRPRRDRLSDLQDCILGHILSFLPTQEAGRAAILSRRWRNAFAEVHTISFEPRSHDTSPYWSHDRTLPMPNRLNAALLARRRCGGVDATLRSLRLVMLYSGSPSDSYALDQWLSYALRPSLQELFLATSSWAFQEEDCGRGCPRVKTVDSDSDTDSSSSDDDSDDDGKDSPRLYVVPAKLYSCATMRALHLVSCSLSVLRSTTIDLPSLETLSLSRIPYWSSVDKIQRLITGCPRLADLTLEACHGITDLTVLPNVRLRSLALRCCHDLRRVNVDLSETRTFEYRDAPPDASCFTLVGGAPGAIVSAKIDVCCQASAPMEMDFGKLKEFLLLFVDTTSLQLQLIWPTNKTFYLYGYDDLFAHFPLFENLTRLELGTRLTDSCVVQEVPGILLQTPNLTALSLKLCRHKLTSENRAIDLYRRKFTVADVPDASAPCLRERVRELSVEQYQGANVPRMLIKSLLRGALVLESIRVVFANGRHSMKVQELMDEIRTWSRIPATRISFS